MEMLSRRGLVGSVFSLAAVDALAGCGTPRLSDGSSSPDTTTYAWAYDPHSLLPTWAGHNVDTHLIGEFPEGVLTPLQHQVGVVQSGVPIDANAIPHCKWALMLKGDEELLRLQNTQQSTIVFGLTACGDVVIVEVPLYNWHGDAAHQNKDVANRNRYIEEKFGVFVISGPSQEGYSHPSDANLRAREAWRLQVKSGNSGCPAAVPAPVAATPLTSAPTQQAPKQPDANPKPRTDVTRRSFFSRPAAKPGCDGRTVCQELEGVKKELGEIRKELGSSGPNTPPPVQPPAGRVPALGMP